MKTDVKLENIMIPAVGVINCFHCGGGNKIKARPKFEGETIELDGVWFD